MMKDETDMYLSPDNIGIDEWKAIVLKKMGLVEPVSVDKICRSQNGVQAQFQTYADEAFRSRLSEKDFSGDWSKDLVRQWSIRGTVHAYLKEEIGLYLYEGRNYFKPSMSIQNRDGKISLREKKYYGDVILDSLKNGNKDREELKRICREAGLNEDKEKSLFNAWGGIIASLVSEGLIFQEYGRRRFGLLEEYKPIDKESAEIEIARRYFSGFGPVSLADARYYFKEKKSTIEAWMGKLDLKTVRVDGKTRYYLGDLDFLNKMPEVIFIAGFDALLLAFEKRESLFFNAENIRDLYTLTGIVKPSLMLNGNLVASWRKEGLTLYIKPFVSLKTGEIKKIRKMGEDRYNKVIFE